MATAIVRNYCLWAKHIEGDPQLAARVVSMRSGETLMLSVDGIVGRWQKMADAPSGAPTPGLRPTDRMRDAWHTYFREKRGSRVEIAVPGEAGEGGDVTGFPPKAASEADRKAALDALWTLAHGWRSDGPYGPRDALYER